MGCSLILQEPFKGIPGYPIEDMIIDAMCMKLVQCPENYDVLVLPNLYGDIVSDLCAGLVGGLGVVPGINMGDGIAVFEPVHGSAPDISGKGIANPTAMLLSAVHMLRFIGETDSAQRIERSVSKVIREGRVVTGDLGGSASTEEFTGEVIASL